jgi:hypothetical protein
LSWSRGKHYLRLGGAIVHHRSGGFGSEPGTAILGTFTFKNTTTAPLDQLTLADVQNYTQPINFGISTYNLPQWLNTVFVQDSIHLRSDFTLDVGLRYDRQTLTDAKHNFAPRIGIAWHPYGDPRTSIRGGYAMYYTQIRSNAVAGYLVNGLDGLTTYTAAPGQTGFPTCLVGSCLPVPVDPKTIPAIQLPARDITIKAGLRSFYQEQFARYGLNFNLLPNYPDELVNPRSQVITVGAEHEFFNGFFFAGDFVHQHWSDLDRTVDLNAPTPFIRTGTGPTQIRSVGAANGTRPIMPVNGGVRQVNVIMNLGVADYDGFQTQFTYRGRKNMYASVGYTISRALNNFEPDGNGIAPNESHISRLGWYERGPSVVDQRHRAVIVFNYRFPYDITAGTVSMFASGRPFSATTGVDNNGDGLNNDRPFINGTIIGKSAFHGTSTQDVAAFVEKRIKTSDRTSILLRIEGFNLFNHGNFLGRGVTIYGNDATPAPTFGQFVGGVGTATNAIPAFAHIDPPRMFQLQARFVF